MNGTKLYDARIVSVNIGPSHITRVHHVCPINIILFAVLYQMYLDFSVTRRDTCLVGITKGFKIIEVLYLLQFHKLGILPVVVSVLSIKNHCLFYGQEESSY